MIHVDSNQITRAYQAGETIEALALRFDCSTTTILNRLRKLGITRRPRGAKKGGTWRRNRHKNAEAVEVHPKQAWSHPKSGRIYLVLAILEAHCEYPRYDETSWVHYVNIDYAHLSDRTEFCRPLCEFTANFVLIGNEMGLVKP